MVLRHTVTSINRCNNYVKADECSKKRVYGIFKLDMSRSNERHLMKINTSPHMKPCRITDVSNELAAGRHLRNRSITVVRTVLKIEAVMNSMKLSLDNSAVNKEVNR
jgi:hypothetical protein